MKWLAQMIFGRSLFSGNRFFRMLAMVGLAFRIARKLSGTAPKVLYTHELKAGEALVVSDLLKQK